MTTPVLTCAITGKKDNLNMHAMRNNAGEIIGWVFVADSVVIESFEADMRWKLESGALRVGIANFDKGMV